MRDRIQRLAEDPDWLPSVSRDITDAIHAELPDVAQVIRIPPKAHQQLAAVRRAESQLERFGRRSASDEAIAQRTELKHSRQLERQALHRLRSIAAGLTRAA